MKTGCHIQVESLKIYTTMWTIMMILMFWYLPYLAVSEAQDCRQLEYSQPVQDRALSNHEIIKLNTTREDICSVKCFIEPNCLSFNVGPKDENHQYLCEISDSDEALHPGDLVPRMGFTYQGTQSPCSNSACAEHSTCQAGYTSKGYRCICLTGFTGSSCSQDINECNLIGGHDCHMNAGCVNTEGSFNCICSLGYTGDGRHCTDIDECNLVGGHDCHVNAGCVNTAGSFNCICSSGYIGDGRDCKECVPVGVEDRNKIPDGRMTASTYYSNDYHPYYGRLNGNRGYGVWCPQTKSDSTDYLQVDMGAEHSVCAVATQGETVYSEWTTNYKVHLSTDGVTWNSYKENNVEKVFAGNTDGSSIVKRSLTPAAKARFVRFYAVTYNEWPCLAVEIFVLQ